MSTHLVACTVYAMISVCTSICYQVQAGHSMFNHFTIIFDHSKYSYVSQFESIDCNEQSTSVFYCYVCLMYNTSVKSVMHGSKWELALITFMSKHPMQ